MMMTATTYLSTPCPGPSPYRAYHSPPPYHHLPPYDIYDNSSRHLRSCSSSATAVPSWPSRPSSAVPSTVRPSQTPSPPPGAGSRLSAHQAISGFLRRGKKKPDAGSLHPLLGMKPPPLLFDVRFPDTRLQVSRQWAHATHGLDAATHSRATYLRIVFDDCPWTIDVRGVAGAPVTPADVFRHLYLGLAQPMSNTEWSLADDTRRRAILKANLKRTRAAIVQDVRRVDWLGKRTLFSSMRRCTSTERRWLATDDYDGEVWIVSFENNQA